MKTLNHVKNFNLSKVNAELSIEDKQLNTIELIANTATNAANAEGNLSDLIAQTFEEYGKNEGLELCKLAALSLWKTECLKNATRNGHNTVEEYVNYLQSEGKNEIKAYSTKSAVYTGRKLAKLEKVTMTANAVLRQVVSKACGNYNGRREVPKNVRLIIDNIKSFTTVKVDDKTTKFVKVDIALSDEFTATGKMDSVTISSELVTVTKKERKPSDPKGDKKEKETNNGNGELSSELDSLDAPKKGNEPNPQIAISKAMTLNEKAKRELIKALSKDPIYLQAMLNQVETVKASDKKLVETKAKKTGTK